ncbi:uncharacterized protein I303_105269 [Kwoniella dejecticola CBS 10117]|uniref:Uncharacterized protein n=1 Tax=Kwoniella dejecticola CBS 10117 TaxID=1296121 RepID=A0A1A6A2Z9_9TREE|nr:uncharacterized protein I303_05283 [Kwoniella dejecticola CBS 10117]OBR84425.1 hypothetical protein I303_05283 [Kwoniella dejecticola CBS 10117]
MKTGRMHLASMLQLTILASICVCGTVNAVQSDILHKIDSREGSGLKALWGEGGPTHRDIWEGELDDDWLLCGAASLANLRQSAIVDLFPGTDFARGMQPQDETTVRLFNLDKKEWQNQTVERAEDVQDTYSMAEPSA